MQPRHNFHITYNSLRSSFPKTHGPTVGIFGGSFSPFHEGHLYIIKQAKKQLLLQEVWLFPCSSHPTKIYQDNLSTRISYIRRDTESLPYVRIMSDEGFLYTYQLIRFLKKRYRHYNFVLLLGSDLLLSLHLWKHYTHLIRHINLAVFHRAGYKFSVFRQPLTIRYRQYRRKQAKLFKYYTSPSWIIINGNSPLLSSSQLSLNVGVDTDV